MTMTTAIVSSVETLISAGGRGDRLSFGHVESEQQYCARGGNFHL